MSKFNKTLKLLEQVFCAPDEGDDPNDIITLPNGDKRIELDDSEAKILYSKFKVYKNNAIAIKATIDKILDYNTLYKRLPLIRNIKCNLVINPKLNQNKFVGRYKYNTKTITVKVNDKEMFEIFLFHELQHVIQHLCNMDSGSSPENCRPSDDIKDIDIINFYKDNIENKIDIKNIKNNNELFVVQNFSKIIRKKYINSAYILALAIEKRLSLEFFTYYNLMGEIEAVETENRLKYSKQERKLKPPTYKK